MSKLLKKKISLGGLRSDQVISLPRYSNKGIPRNIEILFAIGGMIVLFPLFILCSILVILSSRGSVFFRQKRVGFKGEIFTIYKFRTMTESEKGPLITADGDRRITKVGRILRKTKLDEIPEIYNVLRGEMSFVGPRPEVPRYVDLKNPLWKKVLSVRPGLSDPVTLQLRNEEAYLSKVDDKETFYKEVIQPYKLEESIKYLETKSFYNDLIVIFQTFKVIIFPGKAPQPTLEEVKLKKVEFREV